MIQRIFLGYENVFLSSLVTELLRDEASLRNSLILVPTTQSGRLLREALVSAAEKSTIFTPEITTPGTLLRSHDSSFAPAWIEHMAWMEYLSSIKGNDWDHYSDLFPIPPSDDEDNPYFFDSLAQEMVSLRKTLQDSRYSISTASKYLAQSSDAARWQNLAQLENGVERLLTSWGYQSKTDFLRKNPVASIGFPRIILAGLTDLPECLKETLHYHKGEIISLIPSSEMEKEHFCSLGLPLISWATRELPLAEITHLEADPYSQAALALKMAAQTGVSSDRICLGSADEETGSALARVFTEAGWIAFHTAEKAPPHSLEKWLNALEKWISFPSFPHLVLLLSLPECSAFLEENRAEILFELQIFREKKPSIELHEVRFTKQPPHLFTPRLRGAIECFMALREAFLSQTFSQSMENHLNALSSQAEDTPEVWSAIEDFLHQSSVFSSIVKRSHGFWLKTLISIFPKPTLQAPENHVVDVRGWLELLFDPAENLILCGMNESFIPGRLGGEPWLSQNIRKALHLPTDSDRHARDAFLLYSLIKMRQDKGTVHLICGKNGTNVDTLLPSRLLLQIPRSALVSSVENLFREIEPPEANLIWSQDWKWQITCGELASKISVTALRDYLECPFRFYLKHLAKIQRPDPERKEMNERDFGNVMHLILENWGKIPENRRLHEAEKIFRSLQEIHHEILLKEFGTHRSIPIEIQSRAILNRLKSFSQIQAQLVEDGWQIRETESPFKWLSNDLSIRGTIDRIDQHLDHGEIRVIDYKTGNTPDVEKAHRKKLTANSKRPAHLPEQGPMFQNILDSKGKEQLYQWINLQLPLYGLAKSHKEHVTPAYLKLGAEENSRKLILWESFSQEDIDSAKECMDWITQSIQQRVFWPPSEKVKYDDYQFLVPEGAFIDAFHFSE